ncbi:MAG: NAD+ synthase [Desulfofustis sp.]|nr:NAD+ synthase [Desulfofustis sp.]
MKIALIQLNPVIGSFADNCRKIIDFARQAAERGCSLAIFPEMAVSGYPPLDLLERRSFVADHQQAVRDLVAALPPIGVLFGCFEPRPERPGKPLYNSVVLARNGAIVQRIRKQLLPTYDVFDETRYFEPGPPSDLLAFDGLTIAVTVCEDIWHYAVDDYRVQPLAALFDRAAAENRPVDLIVNVSASPYHRGKETLRQTIFSRLCRQYRTPFLYVNQVGGQDSLLFDGGSLACDRDGTVVARARLFAEDLVVVDSDLSRGDNHRPQPISEVAAVHDALVMGLRDYVRKCGFSQVVLGLSGGIDSALTAVLAVEALGAEQVLGVALPSPYSSEVSLRDAAELARRCGCRFEVLPISELFAGYRTALAPLFTGLPEDVTEQNIQARIRGNLLMALSNKFNHLLLTTGNKSEMAVGYCTLYGDMSGGLAVIADVPKQLVYDLAHHINREREIIPAGIISRPPTAELRPDQLDQDDLPPYEVLDAILELYLEQGYGRLDIIERGFEPAVVDDIVRRIRINEYKRKQAPIGLKVTSKAFGFGRRLPNVQNYQG